MLSKVALTAVVCSLLLAVSGCDKHGRYQIVAARGSNAQEDRVWMVDTDTGRVSLCYETSAHVACLEQSEAPGLQAK